MDSKPVMGYMVAALKTTDLNEINKTWGALYEGVTAIGVPRDFPVGEYQGPVVVLPWLAKNTVLFIDAVRKDRKAIQVGAYAE